MTKIIDYNQVIFDNSYYLQPDAEEEGCRIDKFLSERIPEISRSYIQKLIKDGCILLDNHSVKSNYKVSSKDIIEVSFPKPKPIDIKPENIELEIVHEDNDIIIVNKPKDMVVHPAPGHYSGTLVNALMYHCGNNLSGINGILRPGIVHRIDKDTTGLLIVCKNDISHQKIAEQLSSHTITRRYQALVHGSLPNENGTINKPISRGNVERKIMTVNPNGKNAITHYNLITKYEFKNKQYSHIECKLETGRTHQIRVHMSYINHPLVGDTTYGYNIKNQPFKTMGQMLHAKKIGFIHPTSNSYVEYDSCLPEYFINILERLQIIS